MLPLVTYESSSDSEGSDNEASSSTMPPLPNFFSPVEKKEDPSKHQGRIRTKPHIENSWATYVYVEVPVSDEVRNMVQPMISNEIHSMIQDGNNLHVSLSRCIFLKEHQLEMFAQTIRDHVTQDASFNISFAQVSILTNDEKTRSFITTEIGEGYNELLGLLKSVDTVMEKLRLPVFYKPARFHASVAWSLSESLLEEAIGSIPTMIMDDLNTIRHLVSKLMIKMGNRIVEVPLSSSKWVS
ncbi:U6 snRNA phosphodiesterase Usb1 [Phascolomyces articulosus]|uniref:U6 snRNA phosphodiesterase 1 n=1 Tax=Phascolomyces articulosus TaxID=60185 RepID=A0AAD5JWT7_9FUNG|nr:U6 snRNA phosphodiesterase Usb1 [Phascolomyces articulosus]